MKLFHTCSFCGVTCVFSPRVRMIKKHRLIPAQFWTYPLFSCQLSLPQWVSPFEFQFHIDITGLQFAFLRSSKRCVSSSNSLWVGTRPTYYGGAAGPTLGVTWTMFITWGLSERQLRWRWDVGHLRSPRGETTLNCPTNQIVTRFRPRMQSSRPSEPTLRPPVGWI